MMRDIFFCWGFINWLDVVERREWPASRNAEKTSGCRHISRLCLLGFDFMGPLELIVPFICTLQLNFLAAAQPNKGTPVFFYARTGDGSGTTFCWQQIIYFAHWLEVSPLNTASRFSLLPIFSYLDDWQIFQPATYQIHILNTPTKPWFFGNCLIFRGKDEIHHIPWTSHYVLW